MNSRSIALMALLVAGGLRIAAAVLSPDDCSQEVDFPELSFSPSPLFCEVVWSQFNFILRYHYNKSLQRLSVVLSTNFASNWFSMGFSPTGAMIGSSAMVGYMSFMGGNGVVNQYYLAGKTSDEVIVHQGNLTVVPKSGVVTLQNQTMYMAFQIDVNDKLAASSKVIYAYGFSGITPNSSGYIEGPHRAAFKMSIDFTTDVYLSFYEEWQLVECGIGVMSILHGHLDNLQYEGRTEGCLVEEEVFIYEHLISPWTVLTLRDTFKNPL